MRGRASSSLEYTRFKGLIEGWPACGLSSLTQYSSTRKSPRNYRSLSGTVLGSAIGLCARSMLSPFTRGDYSLGVGVSWLWCPSDFRRGRGCCRFGLLHLIRSRRSSGCCVAPSSFDRCRCGFRRCRFGRHLTGARRGCGGSGGIGLLHLIVLVLGLGIGSLGGLGLRRIGRIGRSRGGCALRLRRSRSWSSC